MNDKELSTQIMNYLSLQKTLKGCIKNELDMIKEFNEDYAKGRLSAFKLILEIIEDDQKNVTQNPTK